MAGSNMWFAYTADSGLQYAVKLDESNAKAAGFPVYDPAVTGAVPPLPRGMKMRYANCVRGLIRRKIYIPSLTSEFWTDGSLTINLPDFQSSVGGVQINPAGYAFAISSTVGQKFRRPFVGDTGLDDGSPNG